MPKTAIVVIGYKKHECLNSMLRALSVANELFKLDINIYIDGCKDDSDFYDVNKTLEYALIFAAESSFLVNVYTDHVNKGLSKSVTYSVTHTLNTYDSCIVLEDDIKISQDSISFCLDNLKKFELANHVSSICLNNPVQSIGNTNFYLTYRMTCWGWATWKNRWNYLLDPAQVRHHLESLSSEEISNYVANIGKDSFKRLHQMIYDDKDIWACRWIFSQYIRNSYSLLPTKNLSKNIGLNVNSSNFRKRHSSFIYPLIDTIVSSPLAPPAVVNWLALKFRIDDFNHINHLLLLCFFSNSYLPIFSSNRQTSSMRRPILLVAIMTLPIQFHISYFKKSFKNFFKL